MPITTGVATARDGHRRQRQWWGKLPRPARGRPMVLLRRALAASLFGVAALLAAHPVAAGGEGGHPTVVAAHDLAAGTTLGSADVRIARFPVSTRPAGALDASQQAIGKILAGPARAGEPITDIRLIGPRSAPPGMATVPIRLADADIANLLYPGATVDVVTIGPGQDAREVVAPMADVLTVLPAAPRRHAGGGSAGDAPLVLLSVPAGLATRLAAVSLDRPVTVTLR